MVFEKVRSIICEQLGIEEDKVTLKSNITDDLGVDSIDIVDLVMSLEDEFELEMSDDDISKVKTVGDIVDYIESKREQ